MAHIRITVLSENTATKSRLIGEHGFALWLEVDNKNVLFDTGQQGQVITHNAANLNIDLHNIDALVLSHGHYDHTGGLNDICSQTKKLVVYAHPDAFDKKYSKRSDGSIHDAGIPASTEKSVESQVEIKLNKQSIEIYPDFYLTGNIPRLTGFEDTGGAFFLDRDCTIPDLLLDDQAAFIKTASGLVVILGCAHSGIINTLRYIRQLTDNAPIHTVIGGMHLMAANEARIDKTIAELREFEIKRLYPAHCTGFEATTKLWQSFTETCTPCSVGMVLEY